jgi:hypothetical protein
MTDRFRYYSEQVEFEHASKREAIRFSSTRFPGVTRTKLAHWVTQRIVSNF